MRALLLVLMLCGVADAQERFLQDRFAIGLWVDPPADDQMEARYAELAAANFTFVIGAHANTPEKIDRQLALCAKHDLKAIVARPGGPVETWPEHPALWGYTLRDEPNAADFEGLAATVEELRGKRPGRLGYINLFPTYASAEQLGTATYEEHVQRFMDTVNPDVLSMDHYPRFTPTEDTRDAYCDNLEYMRRHSLAKGVPFWNFFNIMPYGPHFDPTEAQVRWQIFASLCYGAKGVMYFCYWTPRGGEFPKGGAILRADGTRTRHYDEATRINAGLRNLGPVLMALTNTGVVRLPRGEDYAPLLAGTPLAEISDGSYLAGFFTHADGRRAVLLMNYEHAWSAWPTVMFDAPAVLEVIPATGAIEPVYDDSPDMEGLQVSLDAGAGRLFLLDSEAP